MRPPEIEVTIDELVLHGFDGRHADAFERALQHELSRLVASGSGLAESRSLSIPDLAAGTAISSSASDLGAAGTQVARALHGRIGR